MSNDILSAAEIDALFDQANQGRAPSEQGDAGQGRRARWLRTVDFTRPSKFGIDQQRRLRRIMEVFCATASTRLSAEHRIDVNLEVIDAGQFTFANALESVPEASVAAVVETTGDTKLLMTAELVLVLEVIERLLGGTGDGVVERQLTDIERVLARRLFGAFVECLSTTWHDVCGASLELGRVDPLGEGPQIVPASEPTLVLTVEARLARRSTTLALVVPWATIAPVAAAFASPDEAAGLTDDPRAAAAVRAGLSIVDVDLRAEVGATTMALEDVLALRPGDVVKLESVAGEDAVLYADGTPVHRARAGRSGTRRAVQILGPYDLERLDADRRSQNAGPDAPRR
jgi:flagellar motor switch protein FliM